MTDNTDNVEDESSKQAREERRAADARHLQEQIAQLQGDLRAIAAALAKISGDTVADFRERAEEEYQHATSKGRYMFDDVSTQASDMEQSLKRTIRERPFTAVAGALGIGYLLALLSRR